MNKNRAVNGKHIFIHKRNYDFALIWQFAKKEITRTTLAKRMSKQKAMHILSIARQSQLEIGSTVLVPSVSRVLSALREFRDYGQYDYSMKDHRIMGQNGISLVDIYNINENPIYRICLKLLKNYSPTVPESYREYYGNLMIDEIYGVKWYDTIYAKLSNGELVEIEIKDNVSLSVLFKTTLSTFTTKIIRNTSVYSVINMDME